MKAVRLHQFGEPPVISVDQVPNATASEGEYLVEIRASSLNPVDWKMCEKEGFVKQSQLPFILGGDLAGVVRTVPEGGAVGEGAEVYGLPAISGGAFAGMASLKPEQIATKPASLDFVTAAAVPLAALTAWQGLFDYGQLAQGQRVLIHGGAGGVGGFAVQMAKQSGAYVFATGGPDNADYIRSLGADKFIDYKSQRFEDIAQDLDLVLDLIGGETQERSFQTLKRGGRLISTLQQPDVQKMSAVGITGEAYMMHPNAAQLAEIAQWIDAGKIKVTVYKTYALESFQEAFQESKGGHVQGKIVFTL